MVQQDELDNGELDKDCQEWQGDEKTLDYDDTYDELLQNGMFRNREYNGLPISGSNADFIYDAEEEEEHRTNWDRVYKPSYGLSHQK